MLATELAAEVASPTWEEAAAPRATVVVATYRRRDFLPELVSTLEAQDLPAGEFEVVVVDDGSGDGTWSELSGLAVRTPLSMLALLAGRNGGPATARHLGAGRSRAPVLAFTDDDCLPAPGWLRGLLDALDADAGVDVVQGRTEAVGPHGPWDHTLWVTRPTPWFETCNIAYRRSAYDRVGGFDLDDPVLNPRGGSHFGEDVDLGARVLATGGRRAFAPGAVVAHRVLPGTYASWLAARRRLRDFPSLARRSAVVRDALWRGVFLDRSTARFDLAVAGAAAACALRRPWPLLAAVPWLRRTWAAGGGSPAQAARLAVGDAVGLASLVRGSVEHRRVVL